MLIVGSITNVSVAAMFIGGLAPAAVMAIALMVLIYVRARRSSAARIPRQPAEAMLQAALGAVLPLLLPGILLAGILLGIATPTEVAAFAVVYGLFLAIVVYRDMGFRKFMRTVAGHFPAAMCSQSVPLRSFLAAAHPGFARGR